MDGIEVQSGVPVQKFYRAINCGGVFIQDLPFDEAEHDWPVPVDDSSIVQQSEGIPYSLVQCFEFIEDGLLADDGRLVKEATRKVLKSSDNIVINSLQITQIQAGAQQGIFKVDCKISADRAVGADGGLLEDVSTGGEFNVSLVVGISRHPALNDFIKYDHRTLSKMREDEAAALDLSSDGPAYAENATLPGHFGEYEKDGAYFYLAEFLDGYMEMNLFCTGETDSFGAPKRKFILNGINLNRNHVYLDEFETSRLLAEIAVQQVVTALRCGLVLCPAFRAGDYLYNPAKDRVMLHCVRPVMVSPNGLWGCVHQRMKTVLGPEIELVGYQLLQLLFWQEDNLEINWESYPGGKYFVISIFDIIKNIQDLIKKVSLDKKQWQLVVLFLDFWRRNLGDFIEDEEEYRVLEKRIRDLQMMLQMQLSLGSR